MLDATQALTVIAPIHKDKRPELDRLLQVIAEQPDTNEVFRPKDLPYTHFMRFVVIEGQGDTPALLAWESNHDRETETYLDAVLHASTIERILCCCIDFPLRVEEQLRWALEHTVRASAFYTAYRGIPRDRVKNDRKVHDALRELLDEKGGRAAFAKLTPSEIQLELFDYVRTKYPELDIHTPPDQEWRWWTGRILTGIGFVFALPFLVAGALPWWLVLRHKEKTDPADPTHRPVHDDKDFSFSEDRGGVTQNQLTHIVDVKPGMFRYATLVTVMAAIDLLARIHFVRGNLAGITSIHFARWVLIKDQWNKGRKKQHRLLFFSNYDGSWESYLGEFVDRASNGLTAVWSNTKGFPRSRHLIRAGARDEEAFKQWARNHQIKTQVWWSGVPDSTVQNVLDDLTVRRYLAGGLADDEIQAWLRKV